MPEEALSAPTTRPEGRSRRYALVGLLVALTATALAVFGPQIGKTVAQRIASRRMLACELGAARWWLGWSAWCDPGDYHNDLLEAALRRQWKQDEQWEASLERARGKGAPDRLIAVEKRLARYQWGGLEQGEEAEIGKLAAAGASPCDVATAILRGCLAQRNAGRAEAFLEGLPEALRDEAHRDFLWGVYWHSQGDFGEAENRLKRALDARPGHELARAEMAALLLDRRELDRALREYVELAVRSRGSEAATIGLARVLRAQGRFQDARAVLAPLASQSRPADSVLFEMAWIELESGNAEQAERRLRQLPLDESTFRATYSLTLITLGLQGKGVEAQRLFEKSAARTCRDARIVDLRCRLANNPKDRAALDELRRLERQEATTSPEEAFGPSDLGSASPGGESAVNAADLYAWHCSVCHGARGDGYGPAARHLFPRPRNLRTGNPQLVSTLNGVPTPEDLERALVQGVPGTSMPSFKSLTENQRGLLAQEVLRLRREGVREQVLRALREEEDESDEADVGRAVEACTTPGEQIPVPKNWHDLAEAAARGKQSFLTLGCNKCHGDDGRGDGGEPLFDEQGEPTRARDFVYEPFQGGREPQSIYLRLAAGMPGTPMPSAGNVREEQLSDLVQHVRSLARNPQHVLTNFERQVRVDRGG